MDYPDDNFRSVVEDYAVAGTSHLFVFNTTGFFVGQPINVHTREGWQRYRVTQVNPEKDYVRVDGTLNADVMAGSFITSPYFAGMTEEKLLKAALGRPKDPKTGLYIVDPEDLDTVPG